MNITDKDVLFLQQLKSTSEHNRQNEDKKSLVTSKGMLSEDLLKLFEVEKTATGAWFFNVYVTFEAMYRELPAEDWQK